MGKMGEESVSCYTWYKKIIKEKLLIYLKKKLEKRVDGEFRLYEEQKC